MAVRRPTVHDEAVIGQSKAEHAVTVLQWVKAVPLLGKSESGAVARRFNAEYQVLYRFVKETHDTLSSLTKRLQPST